MKFLEQNLLSSLINEVEKLLDFVSFQKEKIKSLEEELQIKNQQVNILKEELKDLIEKVEQFNILFNELPLYNGTIQYKDNLEYKDSEFNEFNKYKGE